MIDKSLILKRLKEVKGFRRDSELANFLGISRSTLSNWNTRNSIDYDKLFSKCEQEDLNYLIKGTRENEKYKESNTSEVLQKVLPNNKKTKNAENVTVLNKEKEKMQKIPKEEVKNTFRLRTDNNIEDQLIPLYSFEAVAGLVELLDTETNAVPLDTLKIPNLPKCDGAIYVTGDSMYPLLKSGDIVAYKEVKDILNGVFWGEMYIVSVLVDDEEYVSVKYIQRSSKGEEYMKLVSQNPHHQPKDVQVRNIQALALVKASIRINAMR